LSRGDYDV
jgi:uncharacterized protein (UPF0303 family)